MVLVWGSIFGLLALFTRDVLGVFCWGIWMAGIISLFEADTPRSYVQRLERTITGEVLLIAAAVLFTVRNIGRGWSWLAVVWPITAIYAAVRLGSDGSRYLRLKEHERTLR